MSQKPERWNPALLTFGWLLLLFSAAVGLLNILGGIYILIMAGIAFSAAKR